LSRSLSLDSTRYLTSLTAKSAGVENAMKLIALLLVFCQIRDGDGSFGKPFYKFLEKAYGIEAANVLDRPDFGNDGSYGGGKGTVSRRPVIIVHGVTNTAMTFKFVRNFLLKSNYTDEEIYGTTWGDGGRRFILWVRLECQYIKQVRVLIQSVVDFTGSKVDVLAYSMGSPISRKAILGGNCGPEDIGPPLTDLIETFVGVAGANYGSDLCFVSFGICNTENGLHCESKMLSHINTQPAKYEARRVYAIYSTADNKVGLDCCGTNCSMIPHSDGQFIFDRWDHDQIMYETLELQLDLIKRA
ncbi:hypothetical protein PENTCL1PPCAC_25150, partial [Pristionchus entomophagus]